MSGRRGEDEERPRLGCTSQERRRIRKETGKVVLLMRGTQLRFVASSHPRASLLEDLRTDREKEKSILGILVVHDDQRIWEGLTMKAIPHLGLLRGLDDDAVGGVVQLPRHNAQKLCLVLVAVVVRRADTYELGGKLENQMNIPKH